MPLVYSKPSREDLLRLLLLLLRVWLMGGEWWDSEPTQAKSTREPLLPQEGKALQEGLLELSRQDCRGQADHRKDPQVLPLVGLLEGLHLWVVVGGSSEGQKQMLLPRDQREGLGRC